MSRNSDHEPHPELDYNESPESKGFNSLALQTTRALLMKIYRERPPQQDERIETNVHNESNDEYIDPAVADRLERSRSAGEILSQLSSLSSVEELTPEMINIAKAQLEKRKWRDSFEGIESGDTVMILTEPADKIFSLKTFNDKILGQQQTDTMIGFRREILKSHLSTVGVRLVDANFKFLTFAFDESVVSADTINMAIAAAGTEITDSICSLIDRNLEATPSLTDEKHDTIAHLIDTIQDQGYPLRYGTAKVVGELPSDIVLAISQGMVAARIHETNATDQDFGEAFETSKVNHLLEEFTTYRDSLLHTCNNTITDHDGFEYAIFTEILASDKELPEGAEVTTDENNDINLIDNPLPRYTINPDLVRAVRKKAFRPLDSTSQYTLSTLEQYIEVLNAVDLVRPFTQLDIQPNREHSLPIQKEFSQMNQYLDNLTLIEPDLPLLHETGEYLEGAVKNSRYTSREHFHYLVSLIDHSSLIFLDVGDLGVDVLRTYEERLHDLTLHPKDQNDTHLVDMMLQVGDRETYAMNKIRETIADLHNEVFGTSPEDKILGLVEGGDEIMLAFDLSQDDMQTKVAKFQSRLHQSIQAKLRVVATAEPSKRLDDVTHSEPRLTFSEDAVHVDISKTTNGFNPRLLAHIVNVQKAERGSDLSKTAEAQLRKYQFTLQEILRFIPAKDHTLLNQYFLDYHLGISEWQITDSAELHPTEFGEARDLLFRIEHPTSTPEEREILYQTPSEVLNHLQESFSELHKVLELYRELDRITSGNAPYMTFGVEGKKLLVKIEDQEVGLPPKEALKEYILSRG